MIDAIETNLIRAETETKMTDESGTGQECEYQGCDSPYCNLTWQVARSSYALLPNQSFKNQEETVEVEVTKRGKKLRYKQKLSTQSI